MIVKRVGLYAAIMSDRIVRAEMAGIQILVPLMLVVGAVAEVVMVWMVRQQHV